MNLQELSDLNYFIPDFSVNVTGIHDLIELGMLYEKKGPTGIRHLLACKEILSMKFYPLPRNVVSNLYRMVKKMGPISTASAADFYVTINLMVTSTFQKERVNDKSEDFELKILQAVNEFPEVFRLKSNTVDRKFNFKKFVQILDDLAEAIVELNELVPERDICLDFRWESL